MQLLQIQNELRAHRNDEKIHIFRRFFKTGPGQYGEGDEFLGLTVPLTRSIAFRHSNLSLEEIQTLLNSALHEERLAGLFILRRQFEKGTPEAQKKCVAFYLKNTHRVNNWDLVDSSAEYILGAHLQTRSRTVLYKLARSKNIWERRIAIIATFRFIRNNDFEDTLQLSRQLLQDPHDLMHKAVGWMLREVGNRDQAAEKKFLNENSKIMPRTMLRYAIEKFPEQERQAYLRKSFP